MKLKVKFLLQILLTVVIIFSAFAFYLNYNYIKFTTRLSYNLTNLYSMQIAEKVEADLKSDMRVIETVKELMEYHIDREGTLERQYVLDMLSALVMSNPDYLAVWTSIELSFLEPNWPLTHGRLRYIAKLDMGNVLYYIDTLDVDEENMEGAYYLMKVGKYRRLIMDPYFYTYSLEDTSSSYLETSLALPITYNNKFIGLEGVDVKMKDLKKLIQIVTPFANSYAFLVSTNGDIAAHRDDSYLGKKITIVYPELKKFGVLDSITKGKDFSVNVSLGENGDKYYFSFTPIVVADPQLPWSLVYVVPISQVMMNVQSHLTSSIIFSLLALVILVIIIWVFIVDISVKIERADEVLKRLSIGHVNESLKLKVSGKDEIATMYESINRLIDNLNSTVEFATQIGRGNLDAHYELKSEDDVLGKSLIEMKMNLKKAREEEEERQREAERVSWFQNGITEINEILRTYGNDLDGLAFEVIKFLVKYLKAIQGGFYIVERKVDEENREREVIKLQVAFAYDKRKHLQAEFDIHEGLLGRAVQEHRILRQEVPEGYVFVTSGLGGETPKNLVIVPLEFEQVVYGVIEILSFNKFEDYHIDFLSQVSFRVASTLFNILRTIESQELLKKYEKQQKEIEKKEKELQSKTEELLRKEQEMEIFRRKYEGLFNALDATYPHLEYSTDFKLKYVNEYFTNLFGLAHNSLIGKDIKELVPEAQESEKWFERFMEDLKKGMVRRKQTEYTFGNKTLIFDETYIPLFDLDGELNTIVCFGVNITKFNIKTNE